MNLTDEQLDDLLEFMQNSERSVILSIREWVSLRGLDVNPAFVHEQVQRLREEKYHCIRVVKAIKSQVVSLCLNMTPTNEQCDEILAALQDAEVLVAAKKTELGG